MHGYIEALRCWCDISNTKGAGETPAPNSSGWDLEKTEKGHAYQTVVAVGCAASAADTGARQELG